MGMKLLNGLDEHLVDDDLIKAFVGQPKVKAALKIEKSMDLSRFKHLTKKGVERLADASPNVEKLETALEPLDNIEVTLKRFHCTDLQQGYLKLEEQVKDLVNREELLDTFFKLALEYWPKIQEILALHIEQRIDGAKFSGNLERLFDIFLAKTKDGKYKMKDRLNKITDLSCLKGCRHLPIDTGAGGGLVRLIQASPNLKKIDLNGCTKVRVKAGFESNFHKKTGMESIEPNADATKTKGVRAESLDNYGSDPPGCVQILRVNIACCLIEFCPKMSLETILASMDLKLKDGPEKNTGTEQLYEYISSWPFGPGKKITLNGYYDGLKIGKHDIAPRKPEELKVWKKHIKLVLVDCNSFVRHYLTNAKIADWEKQKRLKPDEKGYDKGYQGKHNVTRITVLRMDQP
jgi:hypothetical protein